MKKILKGKSFTNKSVALNKAKCNIKGIINKRLTELGNRKGVAIALDGQEMSTTKALISDGWKRNQIYLPNFSEDYNSIKKHHKQTYPITIGKMISRINTMEKPIGYIYMDYMCHFYGNKTQEIDPREDLIKLFEGKMLLNRSVLGVTFSPRHKDAPSTFTNQIIMEIIQFISKAAHFNGYFTLIDKIGGSYMNGGPMHTLIFQVYKKNSHITYKPSSNDSLYNDKPALPINFKSIFPKCTVKSIKILEVLNLGNFTTKEMGALLITNWDSLRAITRELRNSNHIEYVLPTPKSNIRFKITEKGKKLLDIKVKMLK